MLSHFHTKYFIRALFLLVFLYAGFYGYAYITLPLQSIKSHLQKDLNKQNHFRLQLGQIALSLTLDLVVHDTRIFPKNVQSDTPYSITLPELRISLNPLSLFQKEILIHNLTIRGGEIHYILDSWEDKYGIVKSILELTDINQQKPLVTNNWQLKISKDFSILFEKGQTHLYLPVYTETIVTEKKENFETGEKKVVKPGNMMKYLVFSLRNISTKFKQIEGNRIALQGLTHLHSHQQKFPYSILSQEPIHLDKKTLVGSAGFEILFSEKKIVHLQTRFPRLNLKILKHKTRLYQDGIAKRPLVISAITTIFPKEMQDFLIATKSYNFKNGILSLEYSMDRILDSEVNNIDQKNYFFDEKLIRQAGKITRHPFYSDTLLQHENVKSPATPAKNNTRKSDPPSYRNRLSAFLSEITVMQGAKQEFPLINSLSFRIDSQWQNTPRHHLAQTSVSYGKEKIFFYGRVLSDPQNNQASRKQALFIIPDISLEKFKGKIQLEKSFSFQGNGNLVFFQTSQNLQQKLFVYHNLKNGRFVFPSQLHPNKNLSIQVDHLSVNIDDQEAHIKAAGQFNSDEFQISMDGKTNRSWLEYYHFWNQDYNFAGNYWNINLKGTSISCDTIRWFYLYADQFFERKIIKSKDSFREKSFGATGIGRYTASTKALIDIHYDQFNLCNAIFQPLEIQIEQIPQRIFLKKFRLDGFGLQTNMNAYINYNFESPFYQLEVKFSNLDIQKLAEKMRIQQCLPDFLEHWPKQGILSMSYDFASFGNKLPEILKSQQNRFLLEIKNGSIGSHPLFQKIQTATGIASWQKNLQNIPFESLLYKESTKEQLRKIDQFFFDAQGLRIEGSGYEHPKLGNYIFLQGSFGKPYLPDPVYQGFKTSGLFQNLRIEKN